MIGSNDDVIILLEIGSAIRLLDRAGRLTRESTCVLVTALKRVRLGVRSNTPLGSSHPILCANSELTRKLVVVLDLGIDVVKVAQMGYVPIVRGAFNALAMALSVLCMPQSRFGTYNESRNGRNGWKFECV